MASAKYILSLLIFILLLGGSRYSYAQIDSRNQNKPDKQEASTPKKRKKVKKTKREKARASGKKIYSNKKQKRKSKKSFRKGGDKPHKGDITGRKTTKPQTTPRKTYARPQPNPYQGRRIRTERDRAGPPPAKVKTTTKKGEVARTGDISGRKRIRQRSVSTSPRPVHKQPNTYAHRKQRTEKDRAYSNKKQIKEIRTASKPTETRKSKTKKTIVTATAPHRVKRTPKVYRNHEQHKGEQASTKDIAGKKLRTKNQKSAKPSGGNRAMANPKLQTEKKKPGQRFKSYNYAAGKAGSVSSSSEKQGGAKPVANQRNMKNFRSSQPKTVVQAKPPRSYGNRKKGSGEAAIFGAYRAKPLRSVTQNSESKPGKRKTVAPSISGTRVFKSKNAHPYRGKDRRFSGEHAYIGDITGRSLRTKNFHSKKPNYSAMGSINNRTASAHPSNKRYNPNKAKSISGKSFNNNGLAITKRTIGAGIGLYSGKTKASKPLKGGGSVTISWNNNGRPLLKKHGDTGIGRYAGNIKYSAPLKGAGGSISKRWNNNGQPLVRKHGNNGVGSYSGNIKYSGALKGAGGSISKSWNNNGQPLLKKDRTDATIAATRFQGNAIAKKKKTGAGGSITTRWNNKGQPLLKMPRSNATIVATQFKGDVVAKKEKKGAGGSITTRWNNNESPLPKQPASPITLKATSYEGNVFPRGMSNPNIGFYQGDIKAKNAKKKPYPTQDFIGNVKVVSNRPGKSDATTYGKGTKIAGLKLGIRGGSMPQVSEQSKVPDGTKIGKKSTFSFVSLGNPTKGGLVVEQKRLKRNKNLPDAVDRKYAHRNAAAPGTTRGTDWALTFWQFGNPTHMGLKPEYVKAKGKMHPSSGFKNANAANEKDKTISLILLWAKIFKKNAATPKPDKEYSHKLKYDKDERTIWETEDKEDWYNK